MESDQLLLRKQPRTFQHSLDWRFLLPLAHADKTFVFFEDDPDFSETLVQAGIPISNHLSLSDIEQIEKKEAISFVLPFGLPVRWVGKEQSDQIEFFRSIRKIIGETGNMLVGFNNSWNRVAMSLGKYHVSGPGRMASQLLEAGFTTTKIFGAISNLSIPEYIFDLQSSSIFFALQHRFRRRKAIINFLRFALRTTGLTYLSHYFPCYFAVASI